MLLHVCTQPKRHDGTGGGRGRRVGGVLRYLFGPGRAEEHHNNLFGLAPQVGTPYGRLIAASDAVPLAELQPQYTGRGCFDFRPLVQWLEELPRAAGVLRRVDGRHPGPGWVWHASIRLAPEDRHRVLSDDTWAHMAREVLRGAGLVVDGDEAGVRWVVVRHADDHVHIVASLVRADGRREWFHNDFTRGVNATREVAQRFGLRQVSLSKGTAARRPHPVEVHKAARQGRFTGSGQVLTVRDELRRRVRAAIAGSGTAQEFQDHLTELGVQVAFRESQQHPGVPTGVKFALAGDTSAGGGPVWFGGGKLAPDLTWPRLQSRWTTEPLPGMSSGALASGQPQVVAEAERIVARAARRLSRGEPADAAQIGQAAADVMTAAAWRLDRSPGGPRVQAAERLDAATRRPGGRGAPASSDALRLHALAQALLALQLVADDEEDRDTLRLMYSLAHLAERIARLQERQQRHEQAAAAREAANRVRAGRSTPLRQRGRLLPRHERTRHAHTVGTVLPDATGRILSEPGWDGLVATLHDLATAGVDPAEALRVAACGRPPRNVVSVSGLLTWRMRRQAGLDTHQPAAPTRPGRPDLARAGGGRRQATTPRSRPPMPSR